MTESSAHPRRGISLLGVLLCILVVAVPVAVRTISNARTDAPDTSPEVSAFGGVLLDATTNHVLWGRDAKVQRPIASTTKIMTAVVVLESGVDLERQVTMRQRYLDRVRRVHGSLAGLKAGDRLTLRQLLYAMLLPSGSEAAVALADVVGEGKAFQDRESDFVERMNARARSLGLKSARFGSADGTGSGARTKASPLDLALLTKHALTLPVFASVVATISVSPVVQRPHGKTHQYVWRNSNLLLGNYAGVIGVKTGTSTPAGPCLVFAARRDGRLLIGVLLNSEDAPTRFRDAVALMDWAKGKGLSG